MSQLLHAAVELSLPTGCRVQHSLRIIGDCPCSRGENNIAGNNRQARTSVEANSAVNKHRRLTETVTETHADGEKHASQTEVC